MIRYALGCDRGHDFESWFPSSDAYDGQVARGLVTCPACDSAVVSKRIMAPSVTRTDKGLVAPVLASEPSSANESAPEAPVEAPREPVQLLSEPEKHMRALLRAVRDHVARTSEHVGPRFAEEARRIHNGEVEHRSIYGQATPVEARALVEDGIEVHPLPLLPEERN
jgi:hypothetical protein